MPNIPRVNQHGKTMAATPNEYHLVAFDPGGTIGWAHFIVSVKAFSRPEHKVLRYIKSWNCGEFTGQETEQLQAASALIYRAHFDPPPFNTITHVVSEDFELTQLIGGRNLLSPVRINAVLDWECRKHGLELNLQARQMRTAVTKERLKLFGFQGSFRKDEFSAMQHAVTWIRRVKQKSRERPWKLSDRVSANAYWDCACRRRKQCDLMHPQIA